VPEVAILRARREVRTLVLHWQVQDDNLNVPTLTLDYRAMGEEAWSSLSMPKLAHGQRSMQLPEGFPADPVELRLRVSDLAGNVGSAHTTLR
jgi:hypothetical protein